MASQLLLKAVTSARFTQARLMVKMDADVNVKDVEGQTPIIHALGLSRTKLRSCFLRLLLKAGARVSESDDLSRNALMWACRVGEVEDVALLLQHADVDLNLNAQNTHGQTALWIAVYENRAEIVQVLIKALSKYGLNFEVEDQTGTTPAQLAAKLGHLQCLRVMIKQLNSPGKSVSTLINMSKLGQILNCSNITDTLERIAETTPPSQESPQLMADPPRIEVRSPGGHLILDHILHPETENHHADEPVQSPSLLTIPSPSTLISTEQSSQSLSLIQVCPGRIPPRQNTPPGKMSLPREDAALAEHGPRRRIQHRDSLASAIQSHIQVCPRRKPPRQNTPLGKMSLPLEDGALADYGTRYRIQYRDSLASTIRRRSRTSSELSAVLCRRGEKGVLRLPPVVRVTRDRMVAKHCLPRLLEIHVQQLSGSFRDSAVVRPPTPKPDPPPPAPIWGKKKEVAFLARLKRRNSSSITSATDALSAAAAAAAAAGGTSATSAQDTHIAGRFARLFLSK